MRSFDAPSVDEKFELLGMNRMMANTYAFIVDALNSVRGYPSIWKDARRFLELREDYKSAKLGARFSSFWANSTCFGSSFVD